MALISCKECGREVSDSAKVCPHCGANVIKDIFCQNCGAKIPGNTSYCPSCGFQVRSSCTSKKDKTVTALLGLFLGSLGIHYFYLGKTTAGILTIILSACSCGIWSVITFIQAIMILVMSDEEFDAKYVYTDKTFPLF